VQIQLKSGKAQEQPQGGEAQGNQRQKIQK
jgi:hypothetical protein